MKITKKYLKQIAVYWASASVDVYTQTTFAPAEEIACRWEDKQELFINAAGEEVLSRAAVNVGVDLTEGGYLYLGEEGDLDSDHSDPTIIDGAYEIRALGKIPSLKARMFWRTAWL